MNGSRAFFLFFGLYLIAGFFYSILYLVKFQKKDTDLLETKATKKWIFIPGFLLVWPLMVFFKKNSSNQTVEAMHTYNWILLSIFLPLISILSVYYRPTKLITIISKNEIEDSTTTIHPAFTNELFDINIVIENSTTTFLKVRPLKPLSAPDYSIFIIQDTTKYFAGHIQGMHAQYFKVPAVNKLDPIQLLIEDVLNKTIILNTSL